jgi:drug/metabolite transporter (DMT)-like permease
LCACLAQLSGKLLYIKHLDLDPVGFLALRLLFQALFVLIVLNKDSVKVLVKNIPRDQVKNIILNAFLMVGTHFLLFYSIRALPLVEVSLVINLIPLCTAVLGYFILKDKLVAFEVFCLLLAFSGVTVLIIGSQQEEQQNVTHVSIFSYLVVICCCLSIACISILQRIMRKVNPWVTPFYLATVGVFIFNTVALIEGAAS